MKNLFALFIMLLVTSSHAQQMACEEPVNLAFDVGAYTYTLCDFELKNIVTSFGGPTALTVLYPSNFSVTARCPEKLTFDGSDTQIEFAHLAEFKCTGPDTLDIDLYLPVVHLRGTGIVLNLIINDLQPWNITL
jgi:hypothetical protein